MYLPDRCGLSAPWKVTNLPKIIDRKLCGSGFLGRKLGDDDGDEDDEAAEKLSCAQRLMEDKPAEEDGKDRFQTQNHAGKRGGGRAAGQGFAACSPRRRSTRPRRRSGATRSG